MRGLKHFGSLIAMLVVAAGCRTAARVAQYPRVDLALSGTGNRGYFVGTPPPAAEQQTARQMVETDVELPAWTRGKRAAPKPVSLGEIAPPEMDFSEEPPAAEAKGPQVYDIHVVKKGESLWSIAADPAVYGDGTKWRRIFNANRDTLKSPDRVRPGMALKIPRNVSAGSVGSRHGTQQHHDTVFKK